MSRVKRYAQSMVSAYVLLAGNALFTLASVPLALHYLSGAEFGLWALIMQMGNFNQMLIDMGMSASLSRILIDHKDDKENSAYGTALQTGGLVLVVQGAMMVGAGVALSVWLPAWMNIPEALRPIFRELMVAQCVVLGAAYAGRVFTFVLMAHQRYDVANYISLAGFAGNFVALWIAFYFKLGLWSMFGGYVASVMVTVAGCVWAVRRLGFLPGPGRWGRPDGKIFREIFRFGTDVFLLALGQQLIALSPVPVVTRTLGLEGAAVWSVTVKVFSLGQQLVYRIFDFSGGALSEMVVRGERERLKARFGDLVILTGSAAAAVGVVLALCNQSVVRILSHGRLSWEPHNDLLMAVSLFIFSLSRMPFGFSGVTKQVGAMKFTYFFEGLAFVAGGLLLAHWMGFTGVIVSGIVMDLLISCTYGAHRMVTYFGMSYSELFRGWLDRPLRLFAACGGLAALIWSATQGLSAPVQLAVDAAGGGAVAAWLFWRVGLPERLRREMVRRVAGFLQSSVAQIPPEQPARVPD